jgi:hypothetical protein
VFNTIFLAVRAASATVGPACVRVSKMHPPSPVFPAPDGRTDADFLPTMSPSALHPCLNSPHARALCAAGGPHRTQTRGPHRRPPEGGGWGITRD